MLYKDLLINWLSEQKTYKKYSTYTNYYNITHNQIIPNLGSYIVDEINNDILQDFIVFYWKRIS